MLTVTQTYDNRKALQQTKDRPHATKSSLM